ncbi:hypothetical protein [Actinomadura citrea]|uniref:Uncharacterized protein n=1 Tax=Actinomadura citrea TaxID=46158 RepID=A0A7Y9GAA7_9ACTN|nr:hypothetical protein [Actinomadura citrea]NYE12766.1 hypothetical protein [Actinomadura citrea]GGT54264.1 hypothetical protein GCM10010177_08260 [Actinomadura citrea]
MDPDEHRRGGSGRPPVSRPGRRQPAARRTPQSRSGGPRRTPPPRRAASRRERPAPPPPRTPYDDVPYEDAVQDDAFAPEDVRAALPPEDPAGGQARSGRTERRGKAKRGKAKSGKAKSAGRPSGRPPAPERRPAADRRAGGPGPKLYFGAAAVLGVLVLLGVGAVALSGGDPAPKPGAVTDAKIGRPAGTGPSPTSYSSSPSSAAYAGIAARSADPQPLTAGEVFPSSAAKLPLPEGKVSVKLRAKRLDGDCAAAVWGGSVGEELGKGGCTQAARGIYSDTEHGYALAVAVFNLAGSADADRFVARLETTIGAGFVRPLEAPAPLDRFGRGFGMARGLAMGHFAVVSWTQRLDGRGDEKDENLLSLLIEGGKAPAVLGRAARGTG